MMKKQDEWEKAIRSKLQDYEVQPDPADWEAIADRLTPRRRLVPRRWMYAAAAVLLLMILFEGGRRLWLPEQPEPATAPLADARHLPATPAAPTTLTVPVASATPDAQLTEATSSATPTSTANVVRSLQTTGVTSPTKAGTETDVPVADEPSAPNTPPASDASWLAEATMPTDSLAPFVAEVPPSDDLLESNKHIEAFAHATDDARPSKAIDAQPAIAQAPPTRRWAFGMGGGGYSTGLQGGSGANMSAIYAREDKRADLPPYEMLGNTAYRRNREDRIDVKHARPLSFGLGVSYRLSDRWSLQSGLTYTCLTSRWHTMSIFEGHTRQRLHFVGIPLGAAYRIADWQRVHFYAAAGGAVEWNVAGSLRTVYHYGNELRRTEQSQRMTACQWSAYARTGAAYPLLRFLSLYAELGANYYFDNGSPIETIRSAKPFYLSLQTGLRIGL